MKGPETQSAIHWEIAAGLRDYDEMARAVVDASISEARAKRSPRQRLITTAALGTIVIGILVASAYRGLATLVGNLFVVALFFGPVRWWCRRTALRRLAARLVDAPEALEPASAWADHAGFRCHSSNSDVEFTWAAFSSVALESDHIVLIQHAGVAHPLPTAALPQGTSPDVAVDAIARWIREAASHQPNVASIPPA